MRWCGGDRVLVFRTLTAEVKEISERFRQSTVLGIDARFPCVAKRSLDRRDDPSLVLATCKHTSQSAELQSRTPHSSLVVVFATQLW